MPKNIYVEVVLNCQYIKKMVEFIFRGKNIEVTLLNSGQKRRVPKTKEGAGRKQLGAINPRIASDLIIKVGERS